MNDTYSEIIVKRKMSNSTLLLRFLAIIASVIIIFLSMAALGMFGLMAGVFIIWLDIIIFRNTDIEYEYQFIVTYIGPVDAYPYTFMILKNDEIISEDEAKIIK